MKADTLAPPAATWTDDLRLGWGPMDTTHEEFVELVRALLDAPLDAIPAALEAARLHTVEHFSQEERWMDQTGFPARDCHADEHAAVLASMSGVARKVAAGEPEAARPLAQALIDWFPGHAEYLDSALAHWMCKKHLGGQPVVLRRSVATSLPHASV